MKTIHNPVNFQPEQYEILDYFDNQPPRIQYFGLDIKRYEYALNEWKQERESLFPEKNDHQCQHCGQRNVRYVVACLHKPTGKHVCFGDICVARLNFANQNAFKAAQIRSRAAAGHARMKIWAKRCKFIENHPEVTIFIEAIELPVHAKNNFVKDVLSKLDLYGELSVRQIQCVKSSLAKDIEIAAKKASEPIPTALAPEGRVEVEGEFLASKFYDTDFGTQSKMLIQLKDGNKVYGTYPISLHANKGDKVSFTATFSRKEDHFSYFKRPSKAKLLEVLS